MNKTVFCWNIVGSFQLIIPIKYHCWKSISRATNEHPMIFQDWKIITNNGGILLVDYWHFYKNPIIYQHWYIKYKNTNNIPIWYFKVFPVDFDLPLAILVYRIKESCGICNREIELCQYSN